MFFTTELSNPEYESDGLRYITVKSKALQRRADISVFVPAVDFTEAPDVVILLHGVYGSHWAWAMKGGVHRTAGQLMRNGKIRPVILVMPSDGLYGDGSGYLPHRDADYERWIVEEVIAAVIEQIPPVATSSRFFLTGLSMGGYGAMRIGARYPEIFSSFSGLSSITEFSQLTLFLEGNDDASLRQRALSHESVFESILANRDRVPFFRFDCGTDDLLIEYNRTLHQQLLAHRIPHQYVEHSGSHEWAYWRDHIAESLIFFSQFENK